MARHSLLWQIFPAFATVVVLTVAVTARYAHRTCHDVANEEIRHSLKGSAGLLARDAGQLLEQNHGARLAETVRAMATATSHRFTVILRDGTVAADSEEDPARMENHADRPEVIAALRDGYGESRRFSSTVRQHLVYVALPVRVGGQLVAVARVAAAVTAIGETSAVHSRRLLAAAVLSVVVGALASLWLSRRVAGGVAEVQAVADRLAQGDLTARVRVASSRELASLANSLNAMAVELASRIDMVTRQKEEAEAILAGMAEGVIAIDADATIVHLNQAAADILGYLRAALIGANLRERVRNPALYDLLDRTFGNGFPAVEGDVVLRDRGGELYLQVRASRLTTPQAVGKTGAVLVLNNVTRLKRLETLRRDFAANVSHELRTPITTIKGFVETLLDGALDSREDAERFLRIVRKDADRLESLVADLLALAGLERDEEGPAMQRSRLPLAPVLAEAVASYKPKADAKQMAVTVICGETVAAEINPGLFQQAVGNLLDNAIAYSPPGTTVRVTATRGERDVRVSVSDQGRGIPPEHVGRIFERFYRVDKARSRDAGGTGLGLAIAKHVVQAHKGRIEVDSAVGEGSTFTIVLPLA
jgi:two-component system phosphate regulon sensor histidine kinase PhoR